MSSRIVLALFLVVVVFIQSSIAAHLLRTRFRLDDGKVNNAKNYEDKQCASYMNNCISTSECCDGLACTNLVKGFCNYPFEICVCQLPKSANLDRMWG